MSDAVQFRYTVVRGSVGVVGRPKGLTIVRMTGTFAELLFLSTRSSSVSAREGCTESSLVYDGDTIEIELRNNGVVSELRVDLSIRQR